MMAAMPAARKTFYQVLGVKRSANAHDIERAYERFRAQMQKAPGTHDARAAAMAKAAYATLSHPESRAEYDDALGFGRRPVRVGDLLLWAGIAASILCGGWLFYHFTGSRAAGPPQERRFDAAR